MAEQHGSPLTRAIRQVRDRRSGADNGGRGAGWARVITGVWPGPEGRPARRGAVPVVRRTESGGRSVLWRIDRHCVRIIEVRDESGARIPVSGAPDLAEMRERCPDLAPLWDAVRHDLWTSFATGTGRG
ncbi:hypothetical protein [Nocardia sp. NPDC003963]